MSKAMMSGGWLPNAGAQRFINERGGPRTEAEAVAHSLREAERILSETEPERGKRRTINVTMPLPTFRSQNVSGSADALAASLSAVLPVLDRYAENATEAAMLACPDEDSMLFTALLFARQANRATLSAMGGR